MAKKTTKTNGLKSFEHCGMQIRFNSINNNGAVELKLKNGDVINLNIENTPSSELTDFWHGFEYKGNKYDFNIRIDENTGNGGFIYPVDENGHVDTVHDDVEMDYVNINYEQDIDRDNTPEITAKEFSLFCNEHQDELFEAFGKEYPDDDLKLKEEGAVSEYFSKAILEVLNIRDYHVYKNPSSDDPEKAFICWDNDLKEESIISLSSLISRADNILNEFDIDFEHPENTPTEAEYYRFFSDFMEYRYPENFRFKSKNSFDKSVTSIYDLDETLEIMDINPNIVLENHKDGINFDLYHQAVWKLSETWSETKKALDEQKKDYSEYARDFIDKYVDIKVDYVFEENLNDYYKGFELVMGKSSKENEITIYEEPRWEFKKHTDNIVLDYLKIHESDLYNEIIDYAKEHPDGFWFDIGMSLRYDDFEGEYSNDSLEEKLNDVFFIRYSSTGDDGNLGYPNDIWIEDKELVKFLQGMIKDHVKNNIERYTQFKEKREEKIREEMTLNDEASYINNSPLRIQCSQLTLDLEKLLNLNDGNIKYNWGYFKNLEINSDHNNEIMFWCDTQIIEKDENGKEIVTGCEKTQTYRMSDVIYSPGIKKLVEEGFINTLDRLDPDFEVHKESELKEQKFDVIGNKEWDIFFTSYYDESKKGFYYGLFNPSGTLVNTEKNYGFIKASELPFVPDNIRQVSEYIIKENEKYFSFSDDESQDMDFSFDEKWFSYNKEPVSEIKAASLKALFKQAWNMGVEEEKKKLKTSGNYDEIKNDKDFESVIERDAVQIVEADANEAEAVGYYLNFHEKTPFADWKENIIGISHLSIFEKNVNKTLADLDNLDNERQRKLAAFQWNENKEGKNSSFIEVDRLEVIDPRNIEQIVAIEKALEKETYDLFGDDRAEALLSLANYDESSFYFLFDKTNGNFVEYNRKDNTINDVETPLGMLSYLQNELEYRLGEGRERYHNDLDIYESLKNFYHNYNQISELPSEEKKQHITENCEERSFYTWDDLYFLAMETSFGDSALSAKDNARFNIAEYAKVFGIDIESAESPEEAIDDFLSKHPEYDRFNKDGTFIPEPSKTWKWVEWDDMSGHLESPDGKEFFEYDWTTHEWKNPSDNSWEYGGTNMSFSEFKEMAQKYIMEHFTKESPVFVSVHLISSFEKEQEMKKDDEFKILPYSRNEKSMAVIRNFLSELEGCESSSIEDWKCHAIIDNIGIEDDGRNYLKVLKSGELQWYDTKTGIKKIGIENILSEINYWSQEHATLADNQAVQYKDYLYTDSLNNRIQKMYKDYVFCLEKQKDFKDCYFESDALETRFGKIVEHLTDASFDEVAVRMGMSEKKLAELVVSFSRAGDFAAGHYNLIRPSAEYFLKNLEIGNDYNAALQPVSSIELTQGNLKMILSVYDNSIDNKLVDEIYSRWEERNFELWVDPNTFELYFIDSENEVLNLESVSVTGLLDKVIEWDEEEVSELHSQTADDKDITKIKDYITQLEELRLKITNYGIHVLDFNNEKDVESVYEILKKDFKNITKEESKTFLKFATHYNMDDTNQYGIKDGVLFFNTSVDNEGFYPEKNPSRSLLNAAYDFASIELDVEGHVSEKEASMFFEFENNIDLPSGDLKDFLQLSVKDFNKALADYDIRKENKLEKENKIKEKELKSSQPEPENRFDILSGKSEITSEELYHLIEFKHEYSSEHEIEKYTDKEYRSLNSEEKKTLINALLKADYIKYKNCHIARSKLLYDSSETLMKEIAVIDKLNELGYEVYLLPYGYARDSMNCFLKSADSITNGDFLEFKTVISTGKNAGQSVYKDSRKQADNVFISLLNETSEDKVINNIYSSIREVKKNVDNPVFEGLVFLNFEKDGDRTVLYSFDKDGYAIRLDNPTAEHLKEFRRTIADSPVLENPMTEHSSSPENNINHENISVNAVKENVTSNLEDWHNTHSLCHTDDLTHFVERMGFIIPDKVTELLITELDKYWAIDIYKENDGNNLFYMDREAEPGSGDDLPIPINSIHDIEKLIGNAIESINNRDNDRGYNDNWSQDDFDVFFSSLEELDNELNHQINSQQIEKERNAMLEELENGGDALSTENMDYPSWNDIQKFCRFGGAVLLYDSQALEIFDFYERNPDFGLYKTKAGNIFIHDNINETTELADPAMLLKGYKLRSMNREHFNEYLEKHCYDDDFDKILEQLGETQEMRQRTKPYSMEDRKQFYLNRALEDSFDTLDKHEDFWQYLLDHDATPKEAIRIAAADANLYDNCHWLLSHIPQNQLEKIFSDKHFAANVYAIAYESVTHDQDSWEAPSDIGFDGFKEIAVLCGKRNEADRYYGELLSGLASKVLEMPMKITPAVDVILDAPALLADYMNKCARYTNEPLITKEEAKIILEYNKSEDYLIYANKGYESVNDTGYSIHIMDLSYDSFNGESIGVTNLSLIQHTMDLTSKAADLDEKIHADNEVVSAIFTRLAEFYPESVKTFEDDIDKMYDFDKITKKEFLEAYSYIRAEEYDATKTKLNVLGITAAQQVENLKAQDHKQSLSKEELGKDYEESWSDLGLNRADYAEDYSKSGATTEKEFKEWVISIELSEELMFHGIEDDELSIPQELNEELTSMRWQIIDSISEKIVSGDIKSVDAQEECDKQLKENPLYIKSVKSGILPDELGVNAKTKSRDELIDSEVKLSAVQLQGEKFIASLNEKLPYYKNNPWLVLKVISEDMKKNNPSDYELLTKFFEEKKLNTREDFNSFFTEVTGKIKVMEVEKKQGINTIPKPEKKHSSLEKDSDTIER